jgi:aspartate/methionine/tyrosine aminotransferase
MSVARRLLDDADVVVIPGVGFGRRGEGYVRFALSVEEERTKVAAERIRRLSW